MFLNEDYIFNIILQNTYTLSQLKKRLRAIKAIYSEQFFGSGEPIDETKVQKEELEWFKSLPYDFAQNFQKEDFDASFASLEARVEKITPLTVYLAFDAPAKELADICKFVRTNFAADLLVDIKIDPTLIGGCAFIWKGVYKDYSLKARLADNKAQIMSQFKEFLKG